LFYDPSTSKVYCDATVAGTDLTEIDARTYPTTGTITAFVIEPQPYFRAGPGKQGILRKLWFDVTLGSVGGTGAAGNFTPTVSIDDVDTALTVFTSVVTLGTRYVKEYNLNMPGEVFGVSLSVASARDVRINAIEMDIYVPGEGVATDEA
jgi:hypothetical protein